VRIEGRVQGVWFRAWTVKEAGARGLSGWVRNRRDGTVEALFAGPVAEVRAMVDLCRQGPPAARVTNVSETPCDPPLDAGFLQRETG
jgi:acylphosphatase